METFNKPKNLNGAELRAELNRAGVMISDDVQSVVLSGDELSLDISKTDKAKAASIVAAHNGTLLAPELTIIEKLASVGLSVPDLKAALGL